MHTAQPTEYRDFLKSLMYFCGGLGQGLSYCNTWTSVDLCINHQKYNPFLENKELQKMALLE